MQRTPLQLSIGVVAMILATTILGGELPAEDDQPPFGVAAGLFDAANSKTLGLRRVKGVHRLLYRCIL